MKNGDSDDYAGNGGSGGSSGGVAISSLLLKMGTVIPVTVNTFVTSFGSYFSATGGARGNDGADGPAMSDAPAPTEVGHGMGGNIVNYAGLQGGAGGHRGPSRFVDGSSGQSVNGNTGGPFTGSGSNGSGGGGSGNNLQGLELYYKFVDKVGGGANANAWSAPPVLASPPVFYGSGGGGAGVKSNGLTEDGDTSTTGKRPGGLGSPGGIIIEKGA